MIKPSIKIKGNFNALKKLRAAVAKADKSFIKLGIPDGAPKYAPKPGQGEGPSVAVVAAWLEFGTAKMDARPFLGPAIDENMSIVKGAMATGLAGIAFRHWTVEKALAGLGATLLVLVQNKVKSNVGPALSGTWEPPSGYLGYKRTHGMGQRTLIATGLLLRSLTYQIVLSDGAKIEAENAAKSAASGGAPEGPQSHKSGAESRAQARVQAQALKATQKAQRAANRVAQPGRDQFGRFLKSEAKAKTGRAHSAAKTRRGRGIKQ